nr:MAG TPA: hypothetical protein [Caudoviricetes sp.]
MGRGISYLKHSIKLRKTQGLKTPDYRRLQL